MVSDADTLNAVQTLEIDSNIIPAKWMSAILYTMYTDKVCGRVAVRYRLPHRLVSNRSSACILKRLTSMNLFVELI